MNLLKYFIRRYHSPELSPNELKRMLNWWLPFIFNRIKIIHVADNFLTIKVVLKHSIWNRNPNKSLWGGSMFSAADPFFPVMLKQGVLQKGYQTDFFTKSTQVEYIKEAKTNLIFDFKIEQSEFEVALKTLLKEKKYAHWFTVFGVDESGNNCVKAKVQAYLRLRN
tara:strand:- start:156 stop:653 length:498 start_codon:yes stop_codon:yes gene_type:complete